MIIQDFEGLDFGFTCDIDTGDFLLYEKNQSFPVLIKDSDAELFRRHIELINAELVFCNIHLM